MSSKLKDRISEYKDITNYKLLPKIPVIITLNGRSFSKTTALLDKPYSEPFAETICSTLFRLLQEIDGTVFGYVFNDEIIIVARNDQNNDTSPWCDNNLQKMNSIISSIGSLHFSNYAATLDMNLVEPIFTTHIFTVPNVTEAINVVISKQQQNFQSSIQFACLYELLKKGFNRDEIKEMISGSNIDEKIELLAKEGITYNDYPQAFRRGIACYRTIQIVKYGENEVVKNKWNLDLELPIFTQEPKFLQDIFRAKE